MRGALLLVLLTGCCLPDPAREGDVAPCPDLAWNPPCIRKMPEPPDCIIPAEGATFSLFELVDIALQNNPKTKKTWYDARAAAYNVGAARSTLYPTITGDVDYEAIRREFKIVNSQFIGPNPAREMIYDLTISYLFLDFGGRSATIVQAQDILKSLDWTHDQVLQNVMLDVMDAYYSHVAAKELVVAAEENLKDANVSFESAKKQFDVGVVTKVDVLQTQSQVANRSLQLAQAVGVEKTTHSRLARAMGVLPTTKFSVEALKEEEPTEAIEKNVDVLMELADEKRADLKASWENYLAAKQEITIARSRGLPTVNLFLEATRTNFTNAPLFNNSIYTGIINLDVPIFTGFLHRFETLRAQEGALASFYGWRDLQEEIFLQVLVSYYNYVTAEETVKFSKEFLDFTNEAYNATLMGYRQGTQNLADLLAAQGALAQARAQWIKARLDFVTSIAQVAYSTGTLNPKRS